MSWNSPFYPPLIFLVYEKDMRCCLHILYTTWCTVHVPAGLHCTEGIGTRNFIRPTKRRQSSRCPAMLIIDLSQLQYWRRWHVLDVVFLRMNNLQSSVHISRCSVMSTNPTASPCGASEDVLTVLLCFFFTNQQRWSNTCTSHLNRFTLCQRLIILDRKVTSWCNKNFSYFLGRILLQLL